MSVAKCLTHVRNILDELRRANVYGMCRESTTVPPSINDGAHEFRHRDPRSSLKRSFGSP